MSKPEAKPPIPSAGKPANPAGHVRHDKSGRAIWEWAIDTGRHALDSTSRLLKKLELPGLALEEDARRNKASAPDPVGIEGGQIPTFGGPRETDPLAGSRRGFNPYDSRTPPPRKAAPTGSKAGGRALPAATSGGNRSGLLSRLFGTRR